MKITNFIFIGIAAVFILLAGCDKDNYQAPKSKLTGQVVYAGQALGVRSNGVQLELWQHNFQLFNKIPVYVAQDGTFSAEVFDGDYKLTLVRGNGPWADKVDSIDVKVTGATTVDVPVDPYLIIKNESFQNTSTTVTATFTMQQINTTKGLERVRLFIGQTNLVDNVINLGNVEKLAAGITDINQPITLTITVPAALVSKGYAFARIGVKSTGAAEYIYGQSQKIALK
jgi:hypothetical protein